MKRKPLRRSVTRSCSLSRVHMKAPLLWESEPGTIRDGSAETRDGIAPLTMGKRRTGLDRGSSVVVGSGSQPDFDRGGQSQVHPGGMTREERRGARLL